VMQPDFHTIHLYAAHIKQGTEWRGTAILTRESLVITQVKRLPLGRGMERSSIGHGLLMYTRHPALKRKRNAIASSTRT
jgi:hypothetical protein